MARICVIDDNDLMRDSVCQTLAAADHQADGFADPMAAMEPLLSGRFDLAVSDLKMPRLDGIGLLDKLRAGGCETPVILMTAFGTLPRRPPARSAACPGPARTWGRWATRPGRGPGPDRGKPPASGRSPPRRHGSRLWS